MSRDEEAACLPTDPEARIIVLGMTWADLMDLSARLHLSPVDCSLEERDGLVAPTG